MAPFLMSVFFLFYSHVLPFQASAALPNNNNKYQCSPFSCGRLGDLINFPFINNPNNSHCGSLVLNCSDDSYPKLHFPNQRKWYYVDRMSPIERRIIIRDPQLQSDLEQNRCHSLSNFTLPTSPFFNFYHQEHTFLKTFFKCKQQQQHHDKLINTNDQGFFFQSLYNYSGCVDGYVLYFTGDLKESLPALPEAFINNCSIVEHPIFGWWWGDPSKPLPIEKLSSLLAADYSLGWEVDSFCFDCYSQRGGFCQQSGTGNPKYNCGGLNNRSGYARTKLIIIGMSVPLSAFVLLLLCCYSRKRCLATKLVLLGERSKNGGPTIDNFLQNYDSLAPKRYSYTDIKQMTKSFKSKLGQGGYGGVFKGKLRDGRLVAVKVLKEAKGNNGEEFINEVASISRTSHVNIVSLLGFCCERSKRALVYEFMPNRSLDKFIYLNSPNSCSSLSLDKLYDIAVGIARGLAYLHRGCSTRIVHFDIKPHNILLDHNFCPKISDFGLAKLCTRKDSIISMLGVRGTIGYIAPELVCVNYGGVSHKSDVYSYGMMVLEMVGARHNTDVGADHTSEMYFPYWIYEHLEEEEALRLHGEVSADQKEIAKKMILVSLWCIQTKPSDRPSIKLVLEMLEGRLESIETPPKPFLYTPERSADDSSAL